MYERIAAIHDTEENGYLAEAVLDERALDSIREANLGFLALVSRHHADPVGAFGLSPGAIAQIAALDALGRRGAASCPYTLFNLRFEDAAFWQSVARGPQVAGPGCASDEATFARTAVFLAWHLARSAGLTAALALGMTPPVRAAWHGLPLSAIDRAAATALAELAARWGDHPRFWPKLLGDASTAPTRTGSARLLGLQLLAAQGICAEAAGAHAGPR